MRRTATKREPKTGGTAKQKVLAAIERLPADATIEDAIERLVFLAKIDRGLAEVDNGTGIDHAEARRRLKLPLPQLC
jgi:predicted transcriptional regulator